MRGGRRAARGAARRTLGTASLSQLAICGNSVMRLAPHAAYSASPVCPEYGSRIAKVTVAAESSTASIMRFQIAGRLRSTAMMCAPRSLRRWNGPMADVAPRSTKCFPERSVQLGLSTTSLMAAAQSGSMVPYAAQRSTWSLSAWPRSSVYSPVW